MKNTLLFVTACGILLFGQPVSAALVDQDWMTSGDANLLIDTGTGMRWLDLSVTANQSYNNVAANLGQGGIYEGFRFATQSEVIDLWAHAGITNTERVWVQNGEFQAVKDLVNRLGPTVMIEPGLFTVATHTIGMVEGGPPLSANQRWAMELTYAPDGASIRTSANYYTWDITFADDHYSSYLVQPVPLPASIWLLLSGVFSLYTLMRHSHRRRNLR